MNDFNRVAPLYDFLSGIVFGKTLINAQTHFLNRIQPNSEVLIIGGGTGKILKKFDELSIPLSITYIEKSTKMLSMSQSIVPFKNLKVDFVLGDENLIGTRSFDVIFTAFYLDVFNEQNLTTVVSTLSQVLRNKGSWIMTDFINTSRLWQRLLLNIMYQFFRFTTNLEGDKLLCFEDYLRGQKFAKVEKENFYYGMIESAIYHKESH